MKRDMDLVRKLLIAIEEMERESGQEHLQLPGYSGDQIEHHLVLMKDAGLLLGPPTIRYLDSPFGPASSKLPISDSQFFFLSWAGCEFLEEARDDTKWNKAKAIAKDKGGGMAFELLKAALSELGRQAVRAAMGLPQ